MMTTLRSKRRIQRTAKFNLECLDDRIVPSAIGAEAHVAAVSRCMSVPRRRRPSPSSGMRPNSPDSKPGMRRSWLEFDRRPHRRLLTAADRPRLGARRLDQRGLGDRIPARATAIVPDHRDFREPCDSPTAANPTADDSPPHDRRPRPRRPSSTTTTSTTSTGPLPPNVSAQLQSLYSQYQTYADFGRHAAPSVRRGSTDW